MGRSGPSGEPQTQVCGWRLDHGAAPADLRLRLIASFRSHTLPVESGLTNPPRLAIPGRLDPSTLFTPPGGKRMPSHLPLLLSLGLLLGQPADPDVGQLQEMLYDRQDARAQSQAAMLLIQSKDEGAAEGGSPRAESRPTRKMPSSPLPPPSDCGATRDSERISSRTWGR